jgi:hypothetical protein
MYINNCLHSICSECKDIVIKKSNKCPLCGTDIVSTRIAATTNYHIKSQHDHDEMSEYFRLMCLEYKDYHENCYEIVSEYFDFLLAYSKNNKIEKPNIHIAQMWYNQSIDKNNYETMCKILCGEIIECPHKEKPDNKTYYDNLISVYYRDLSGMTKTIDITQNMVGCELKKLIAQREGIKCDSSILIIYHGKAIADEKYIWQYNIKEHNTLHIVLHLRGC